MASKQDGGIVGLVRGLSARFEEAERALTEIEADGRHLQKNLPDMLSDIESLGATIAECNKQISELQTRRDALRSEFMEASFSGDAETERAIQAERATVDEQVQEHTSTRDTAQTNLNRLNSNLNSTREGAFTTLDEMALPDEGAFLEAFLDKLREQTETLQQRMAAAELLYLLPEETAEREQAQRDAERAAKARQKAQEHQDRAERRSCIIETLES